MFLRPVVNNQTSDYKWIYSKGEDILLRLQVDSSGITRANVTFWNWRGTPVYTKKYSVFPIEDFLDVKTPGYGTWLITVDGYSTNSSNSLISRLVRSIAVIPNNHNAANEWKNNDYILGSCFFPARYSTWDMYKFNSPIFQNLTPGQAIDNILTHANNIGLSVLRVDGWEQNNMANVKNFLSQMKNKNINADLKIPLNLHYHSIFSDSTLNINKQGLNELMTKLNVYLSEIANNPAYSVNMIEIGNEPAHKDFWSGTEEQYVLLYNMVKDSIKKKSPQVMILHGATCPPGADMNENDLSEEEFATYKKKQKLWYEEFYKDLANETECWPYHFHGNLTVDKISWRNWEDSLLRKNEFDGVYFQTEGGTCPWHPGLESSACFELMNKIIYSWAHKEKGWLQYNLAYHAKENRYGDQNGWSLIHTAFFAPKFSYGALAGLVSVAAGCTVDKILINEIVNDTISFAAQFNHPGGKLIAFFSNSKNKNITINSLGRGAVYYDIMGNSVSLANKTSYSYQMKHEIQYLLLLSNDVSGLSFDQKDELAQIRMERSILKLSNVSEDILFSLYNTKGHLIQSTTISNDCNIPMKNQEVYIVKLQNQKGEMLTRKVLSKF